MCWIRRRERDHWRSSDALLPRRWGDEAMAGSSPATCGRMQTLAACGWGLHPAMTLDDQTKAWTHT
jgi:hypothetical protein